MEKKARFIHFEFYTDYDRPSDYIVIVQIVDDVPIASTVFKMPRPCMQYPIYPFLKN